MAEGQWEKLSLWGAGAFCAGAVVSMIADAWGWFV